MVAHKFETNTLVLYQHYNFGVISGISRLTPINSPVHTITYQSEQACCHITCAHGGQ